MPTYLYNFMFKNKDKKPVIKESLNLSFKTADNKEVKISDIAVTNTVGGINLNLTQILSKEGYHPFYCNSYKIIVLKNVFEFELIDTEYKEKQIIFTLKAE